MELVSVIIGTYERYDLLQRAIVSVLNQTYKNIELIVVDDCSKDSRYESLRENNSFKFFKLPSNTGLPACPRNHGIKESKGEWICFLDDDDYFFPEKIEVQMKYSKQYDFICTDAKYDLKNEKRYLKDLYLNYWNFFNPKNSSELDYSIISKHNLIINSSVLVRKSLLFEVGLISEDKSHRRVEDYDTWLKLLSNKIKCCKFIDDPLIYYNIESQKK